MRFLPSTQGHGFHGCVALLMGRKRRDWRKRALVNLVVPPRLNASSKTDLGQWLDDPFTPPQDEEKVS